MKKLRNNLGRNFYEFVKIVSTQNLTLQRLLYIWNKETIQAQAHLSSDQGVNGSFVAMDCFQNLYQ